MGATLIVGLGVAVAGCADDTAIDTATSSVALDSGSSSGSPGSVSDDVFADAGPAPEGDSEVDVVITFEPVSETGVPGIDSDDAFCRSWSEYAGSFNALAYAWGVQSATDAAALEVSASAAVAASVEAMSTNLPAEIESNRQAFIVDVPGPFLRRAERARTLLIEAGADEATVVALGESWIAAITDAGLVADDLAITVPPGASELLAGAAQRFAAELPPMYEDPTLDTTQFDISPSLEFISGACPDQGTLAGNDNVDSDGL
jgi:hypothetical protein